MLTLKLDPSSPVPIHRQIHDQIRLAITTGALAPGEKLPTQGEFRERWDVHIETVIRAMRGLVRDGLIESRPPLGRFVTANPPSLSKPEKARRLREQTGTYLAALASLRVTLSEVVSAVRHYWKGRKTR